MVSHTTIRAVSMVCPFSTACAHNSHCPNFLARSAQSFTSGDDQDHFEAKGTWTEIDPCGRGATRVYAIPGKTIALQKSLYNK